MNDNLVCQICGKLTKRIGTHVERAHSIPPKEYYDTYLKSNTDGICKYCGSPTTFINIPKGYHSYCSLKCASLSDETKLKSRETKLKKYGDPKYSNRSLAAQTTKERYGSENYRNLEKSRKTCMEKYGVPYSSQSETVKKKSKETCKKRYGCENPNQSPMIKEKTRNTCIQKYGGTGNQVAEFREKSIETMKQRYGEDYLTLISDKISATKQERYGDSHYNNREKSSVTCQDKYGVSNPAQLRETHQKAALTRRRTSVSNDGLLLDSKWEKYVYDFISPLSLTVIRNVPVSYKDSNVTFIDFSFDECLIEVKSPHLLKGCFDTNKEITIKDKLQVYQDKGVWIVTSQFEGIDAIDLPKIDIRLFKLKFNRLIKDYPVEVQKLFLDHKVRWNIICLLINQYNLKWVGFDEVISGIKNMIIEGGDYLL